MAGIEAFASDVDDTTLGPDEFASGWRHSHVIQMQWRSRREAAMWIRRLVDAQTFAEATNQRLRAAAEGYEAAHEAWLTFHDAGGDDADQAWASEDSRKRMAAAVRDAARHEREAIAQVEAGLAFIE